MSSTANSITYVALDGGPPNIAMGEHRALLPIVVTCARREDAEAIEALSAEFATISPRDAHALAFSVQESSLDIPNTKSHPIYAIRKGSEETGIWVGFKWDRVMRHLGHSMKGKVYSGQFRDIKQAIIYMLDKPGFNFPLCSGDEIPRPTTTLPLRPASAKAEGPTQPIRPRPGLPIEAQSPSPSKVHSPSSSKAIARPASTDSSDDSFATAHGDTGDDLDVGIGKLNVATTIVDDDSLAMQLLAQFITRPTGMGQNNAGRSFRFPITFGDRADEYLAVKMPTAAELWTVLQVRVHTRGVDAFVHYLTLLLGHKFNAGEAGILYSLMVSPSV